MSDPDRENFESYATDDDNNDYNTYTYLYNPAIILYCAIIISV